MLLDGPDFLGTRRANIANDFVANNAHNCMRPRHQRATTLHITT